MRPWMVMACETPFGIGSLDTIEFRPRTTGLGIAAALQKTAFCNCEIMLREQTWKIQGRFCPAICESVGGAAKVGNPSVRSFKAI
jgi:hypothetical protein